MSYLFIINNIKENFIFPFLSKWGKALQSKGHNSSCNSTSHNTCNLVSTTMLATLLLALQVLAVLTITPRTLQQQLTGTSRVTTTPVSILPFAAITAPIVRSAAPQLHATQVTTSFPTRTNVVFTLTKV
jgi:hypothetical protein